jgi:hypothetical protein
MEVIIAALVTTIGGVIVALIGLVRKDVKQAVANTLPVSNGFTRHVMDEFEKAKDRDEAMEKKFDDHLAWSQEETRRLWAAVLYRNETTR